MKRVTSGGIRLPGLAPGLHTAPKKHGGGGDTVYQLTDSVIKPLTCLTDNDVLNHSINEQLVRVD